jgi:hypothetical protein
MAEFFEKLPAILFWGLLIGLIFGYFIARKSAAKKPIVGALANLFHYLGASVFVSVAPSVLIAAVIFHLGFIRDLLMALVLLGVAFVLLVISAATEDQTNQPETAA